MRDVTDPPEVLAIGETMVLVTPARPEPVETAEDFRLDPGGAEANLATHLVALGHRAAWVGAVGNDALGRRLTAQLARRGVDVRWVEVDPTAPTGLYVKDPGVGVSYYRAGSAASAMDETLVGRIPLGSARLVHLSGITPVLSDGCARLVAATIDAARAAGVPVTFDVNYRPALWPPTVAAEPLRRLAELADITLVGLDEAGALWGCRTAEDVREILPGPDHLVVKDGAIDARELGVEGTVVVPAHAVEVVEVVGAGDAFAAGYLAGWLEGRPAAERLVMGHDRAALALASTGDVPREPVNPAAERSELG